MSSTICPETGINYVSIFQAQEILKQVRGADIAAPTISNQCRKGKIKGATQVKWGREEISGKTSYITIWVMPESEVLNITVRGQNG